MYYCRCFSALYFLNGTIDRQVLLNICTEIEGHPDNVAPAILGGVVAGVVHNDHLFYNKENIAPTLEFITLTPNFESLTDDARNVLPSVIPYSDAVFNISRASLLFNALVKGDEEILSIATDDAIHQRYRISVLPKYETLFSHLKNLNIVACFLSGAGATICLITSTTQTTEVMDHLLNHEQFQQFKILRLQAENHGTTFEYK